MNITDNRDIKGLEVFQVTEVTDEANLNFGIFATGAGARIAVSKEIAKRIGGGIPAYRVHGKFRETASGWTIGVDESRFHIVRVMIR